MDCNAETPMSEPVRHPSARMRPEQEEAFDGLLLAMLARKRLLILVGGDRGERGRVFRELADHVQSDGSLVVVATARAGMQVEDMIAGDAEDVDLEAVVAELEERLDLAGAGLLAVEEAQVLDGQALADLADLSLSETPAGRFLQVLLCGSPELERGLARPDLAEAVRDYGVIYRLGSDAGCSTVPTPTRHDGQWDGPRGKDEDTIVAREHDTVVDRSGDAAINPANDWVRPAARTPAPAVHAQTYDGPGGDDGYADGDYEDDGPPEADRPVASRRAAVAGLAIAVGVLVAVGVAQGVAGLAAMMRGFRRGEVVDAEQRAILADAVLHHRMTVLQFVEQLGQAAHQGGAAIHGHVVDGLFQRAHRIARQHGPAFIGQAQFHAAAVAGFFHPVDQALILQRDQRLGHRALG